MSKSRIPLKYNGAPDKNRTCGLQLRRLSLYPTELRARNLVVIFILSYSVKSFEVVAALVFGSDPIIPKGKAMVKSAVFC